MKTEKNQQGATTVEYALSVVGVALFIALAVFGLKAVAHDAFKHSGACNSAAGYHCTEN